MGSREVLMSQQSIVLDLSLRYPRQKHALNRDSTNLVPSLSSAHISPDSDPAYPFGTLRSNYDCDDMTDEEREQSLIKPLMDAHARASSSTSKLAQHLEQHLEQQYLTKPEERARPVPPQLAAPQYLHRRHVSRTVTVLEGDGEVAGPLQDSSGRNSNRPSEPQYSDIHQFNADQARNHRTRARLRQQQLEAQSRQSRTSKILDSVTKWSSYSNTQSKGKHTTRTPRKPRRSPTNSSLRRKDFSNKREIGEFARSGNFIFHRGFSLRRSHLVKRNLKFRNDTELSSFMDYVNINSTPVSDVLPSNLAVASKLKPPQFLQIMRLRPELVHTLIDIGTLDSQRTRSSLSRRPRHRNSIRRPDPLQRRVVSVRRTKSLPTARPQSAAQLQNPYLYALWQRYMMSVLLQRVQFRMFLMASSSSDFSRMSNDSLSYANSNPEDIPTAPHAQEDFSQDSLQTKGSSLLSKTFPHHDYNDKVPEPSFTTDNDDYLRKELFTVVDEEELALLANISEETASLSSSMRNNESVGNHRKVY